MKKSPFFLPFLLIVCAFCKKDSAPNLSQVQQILVNGTWYQHAYLTDLNEDGLFEDTSYPCQFGDGWKFSADNQFELSDELEYCDPDVDSVLVIPGTWELRDNDSKIYMEFGGGFALFDFHIHSINDTLLEIRSYINLLTQTPFEERIVLRR
jgi:hypothetical protein